MKNKHLYPRTWRAMARECKERAGWKCERCGVSQGIKRLSKWTGRLWPVYLQAAHVNHDPENETPELACVCPSCHWRHYRKPGQRPAWMIEKLKHQKLIALAYTL